MIILFTLLQTVIISLSSSFYGFKKVESLFSFLACFQNVKNGDTKGAVAAEFPFMCVQSR